jgi:GH18 family chitinase
MEGPSTGGDLGHAGGFSWHDAVPEDLDPSFQRALDRGVYDEQGGGYYFWDEQENLFWTFDTVDAIQRKVPIVVAGKGLGGVFAWGLGEDAPAFEHLRALTAVYHDYEDTLESKWNRNRAATARGVQKQEL